jgi:protein-S-isoprenylcysteine O-methyltransferase
MGAPLAVGNHLASLLVFGPIVGSALGESRRFRGDIRRRSADPTYWRLQAWQLTGLVLGVLAARSFTAATLPGPAWLWPPLGCAVGLSGVALRAWAIVSLGAHFTRYLEVTAGQQVVVDGPYRHLRHPSYVGAILILTGIGVGLGNAISLVACFTLTTIGYLERIPREEALLRDQLGEPYVSYSAQTKRLIPGVW